MAVKVTDATLPLVGFALTLMLAWMKLVSRRGASREPKKEMKLLLPRATWRFWL